MLDTDEQRGACPLDHFWNLDWVPPHLLAGETNIFRNLSHALKAGPWREAGLEGVIDSVRACRAAERHLAKLPARLERDDAVMRRACAGVSGKQVIARALSSMRPSTQQRRNYRIGLQQEQVPQAAASQPASDAQISIWLDSTIAAAATATAEVVEEARSHRRFHRDVELGDDTTARDRPPTSRMRPPRVNEVATQYMGAAQLDA